MKFCPASSAEVALYGQARSQSFVVPSPNGPCKPLILGSLPILISRSRLLFLHQVKEFLMKVSPVELPPPTALLGLIQTSCLNPLAPQTPTTLCRSFPEAAAVSAS